MEKLLNPNTIVNTITELKMVKYKVPHPHWNGLPVDNVQQRLDNAIEALKDCLVLTKTIQ